MKSAEPGPNVLPLQTSASTIVQFVGIQKSFNVAGHWVPAIRTIDLEVKAGEVITLVGPSGCGKSTLLNMTAGMFNPTQGKVLYHGREVQGLNHDVGYMTQADYLLPWRTVGANIALPLEIKRLTSSARTARVAELVKLVGLEGFEKHYPSQISGGMRKRCALARLLAYDPEMLLMDEPFGALDAQLRLSLQIELLRIARQLGKTVMFVTHDLDEAIALADRCVVFSGRPGSIRDVLRVDLGRERDLRRLRFDERYVSLTQRLWELMAPDMAPIGQEGVRREI